MTDSRIVLPVYSLLFSLLITSTSAAREPRQRSTLPTPAAMEDDIAVYFSPNGNALGAVRHMINSAQKSIDVQAFLLTTNRISEPLINAHRRGVKVRVIFDTDAKGGKYSKDKELSDAGIAVYYDSPSGARAHNKVMVIDSRMIVTGSFNFTLQADKENVENLVILADKLKLVEAYQKQFEKRLKSSAPAD